MSGKDINIIIEISRERATERVLMEKHMEQIARQKAKSAYRQRAGWHLISTTYYGG
jgi:hypothetical protein